MKNATEGIRRYTETIRVARGLYAVTVRENRPSLISKHRLIAMRITRTQRLADKTARELWRQFADPATPGERDQEGEAAE